MKNIALKYGIEMTAFIVLFFSPIKEVLLATGALIMFDTITGVWAAKKKGGWKAVNSGKLKRVVPKLILYPVVLMVAQVAETLFEGIPYVKVASGMLSVVEVKSIYENVSSVLGFDVWGKFQDTLIKIRRDENKD
jgi:hypothetical protein